MRRLIVNKVMMLTAFIEKGIKENEQNRKD